MLNKFFKFLSLGISTVIFLFILVQITNKETFALARLSGGDFVQVFNNTTQQGTWTDTITADSGQIVEFRVTAKNEGDEPAENVQVWGSVSGAVPGGPANSLVLTGKIATQSYGGNEVTDSATVNIVGGKAEGLRYLPGHARLNGVTGAFNCSSPCDISDTVLDGINVGTIQPGDFVEVTFKASVTNTAAPTPTPTPPACTSNGSCSVQTPSACGQTNTGVDNCGNACVRQSAACVAQGGQTQSQSQTVNIAAPNNPGNVGVAPKAGTTATVLPKTGLAEVAWSALALAPIGYKLRRFSKIKKALEDHPSFISAMRQFKSHS